MCDARATARTHRRIAILPIWKEGAATQRFRRGSGPPEKVFNEFGKPSRGRLGARKAIAIIRRSCSDSLLTASQNGLNFRKRDIYAANAHRDRKVGDY